MIRKLTALAMTLTGIAGFLLVPAAAAESAGVRVEQAWARASIGTARPAAAYVTVVNGSERRVALTGASAPAAGHVAVHETVMQGDTMRMLPAGEIEIPPGGRLEMKPGGVHIMLMDLKRALEQGASLQLTLRFADGEAIDATAAIMGPGAMGPGE